MIGLPARSLPVPQSPDMQEVSMTTPVSAEASVGAFTVSSAARFWRSAVATPMLAFTSTPSVSH